MAVQTEIVELIDEILNTGRSAEDVCADRPELLNVVHRRLREIHRLNAAIDCLFPSKASESQLGLALLNRQGSETPRIPGYEIQSILGRGGMGIVYLANQVKLNRSVAIKMLLAGSCASEAERLRFGREAEAIAGLKHPNIVQVYDIGDVQGRPFYTMELIEGGTLAEKLNGIPLPVFKAAEQVLILARAVQSAHNGGVVHRDLKPANILVTEDAILKISDFGLARFTNSEMSLTQTGARMGTPKYMAPEQILGIEVGPSADIYALGNLLYEMLTGQVPFRSESISETERRILSEEALPPSHLNSKIPKDLETICLKCLDKKPGLRYASAGDLADDITRFLQHEAILARPISLIERIWRWIRRNQISFALIVTALTLGIFIVAATIQVSVMAAAQQVEKDRLTGRFESGLKLMEQNKIEAARAIIDHLGDGGFNDLRLRIDNARNDLELTERLEIIRLSRVTSGDLQFYRSKASQDYENAFANIGLVRTTESTSFDVARKVRDSSIRQSLISAIDDWAFCEDEIDKRDWLLDVARRADPDTTGWRDRIRDSATWTDLTSLIETARKVPVKGESTRLFLTLGERMRSLGGDPTDLLKRVQHDHPADFWANLMLGDTLLMSATDQAEGFYRAALASRPNAAVGYSAVGDALRIQHFPKMAIEYYKKALVIDPRYSRAHNNLGIAMKDSGSPDEAIECYRKAFTIDPNYVWACFDMGNALKEKGLVDEALENLRRCCEAQPSNASFQHGKRSLLVVTGKGKEALSDWKMKLDSNPQEFAAWSGYAELCLFEGDREEYDRACEQLLNRFETTMDAQTAEGVARSLSLIPISHNRLAQASTLAQLAVSEEDVKESWNFRYYMFAKGLTEFRQGNFDRAINTMKGEASKAMGPCPLLVISMAQHQRGEIELARHSLAMAVIGFNWSVERADSRDAWICHILRREAEKMILPHLAEFLSGVHTPEDNDERLCYLAACQFKNLYATCSTLYNDVFIADSEMQKSLGYPAARSIAIAASGRSKDSDRFDQSKGLRWRSSAVLWLRSQLQSISECPDNNLPEVRSYFVQQLSQWKTDPDLQELRESNQLANLTNAERLECVSLWDSVDVTIRYLQDLKE